MLPGIKSAGTFLVNKLPSVSYLTRLEDNTNSASYTFTGVSIGTAAPTRLIVLSIFTSTDASPQMINAVTVAGISATPIFRTTSGDPDTSLYYVNVPLGTTATITVDLNGTDGRLIVGVWAINDLSSVTPVSSDSTSVAPAATLSRTISVQQDGITIVAGGATTGSSPVATNFITNFNIDGTESDHHFGGYDIPTATTSKTYSATSSTSFGCAHWR